MLIPRGQAPQAASPRSAGSSSGGTSVTFGDYGIQALEHAYITNRQIESGAYRHQPAHQAWRQGVDQHLPGPSADQEVGRDPHGFGQGLARWWVANVKPGRVLFELSYPDEATARGR